MIFRETPLDGAYIIEPEKISDKRGFFARIWCQHELKNLGLKPDVLQSNVGYSVHKGTLRGLHFQKAPHAEVKIVRCTKGAIFDVIVDLRPASATFKKWFGVELSEDNHKMIYAPEGFAQGYITLADESEMYYLTTNSYQPDYATGVRFDDPAFDIRWPIEPKVISDQDMSWPDFQ